ncbi:hypothetical protein [Actinocrispum sp. NPDC049592]|uniref:hypothetical protein n=1 Tax=Actinocrispum sp. NPDC049592 TaxID=3154835 RepID=UPI00341BB160
MRKAVATGLAVAVAALGLVLGLTSTSEGPSQVRSGSDPMMVNLRGPVCNPAC